MVALFVFKIVRKPCWCLHFKFWTLKKAWSRSDSGGLDYMVWSDSSLKYDAFVCIASCGKYTWFTYGSVIHQFKVVSSSIFHQIWCLKFSHQAHFSVILAKWTKNVQKISLKFPYPPLIHCFLWKSWPLQAFELHQMKEYKILCQQQ